MLRLISQIPSGLVNNYFTFLRSGRRALTRQGAFVFWGAPITFGSQIHPSSESSECARPSPKGTFVLTTNGYELTGSDTNIVERLCQTPIWVSLNHESGSCRTNRHGCSDNDPPSREAAAWHPKSECRMTKFGARTADSLIPHLTLCSVWR